VADGQAGVFVGLRGEGSIDEEVTRHRVEGVEHGLVIDAAAAQALGHAATHVGRVEAQTCCDRTSAGIGVSGGNVALRSEQRTRDGAAALCRRHWRRPCAAGDPIEDQRKLSRRSLAGRHPRAASVQRRHCGSVA
jgi:hypothetical protein